jgi:hypothetical protein
MTRVFIEMLLFLASGLVSNDEKETKCPSLSIRLR